MGVVYRPIKALASGGMADVFIGVQYSETGFSRLCAIKRIKGHRDSDAEFISMFRDEAKVCQSLQHANVVQVLDFTVMEENCALIMEFVQGVNMSTLLKKFRVQQKYVPIPVVLFICAEVAKGLHYVHTRTDPLNDKSLHIVHRDISPSNVLISYEGEVKITDFGIAKAQDNSHQTQVGVIKGKYQYMSPEQFQAKAIDYRTDIYALGCVLWEALAGRKMFSAASEPHLLQLVMQGPPRQHLREFNSEVDDELNSIVARTIALDKAQRYQSAGELAAVLNMYLNSRYKQFSTIDLAAFLKQYLSEELEANKALIKDVLETFNSAEPVSDPSRTMAKFPVSKTGSPQTKSPNVWDTKSVPRHPTSSGTHISVGPGSDGSIQISALPDQLLQGGGRTGLNITLNLGEDKNRENQAQVARGVDLQLEDPLHIARAITASERLLQKEEDTRLGWSSAQIEQTGKRQAAVSIPLNQRSGSLEKILLFSTAGLILSSLLLIVFQYLIGIDVIGGIHSLAALILN